MRHIFTVALILLCSAALAQGVPSPQTPQLMVDSAGSLLSDTYPAPVKLMGGSSTLGVQIDQNTGPLNVATPTVSVPSTTAVTIGTLPTGTKGVYINAFGGDILMGSSADLASGTYYVGVLIASGTSATWSGLTTGSALYLLSNSGGAATATLVAW